MRQPLGRSSVFMDIVFAWNLDRNAYPETVSGVAAEFNKAAVGPLGLVSELSLRLGLKQLALPRIKRIAEYLQLLNMESGRPPHFFQDSFNSDPWTSADRLLALRDELVAAGWRKAEIAGVEKINSFAALEKNGTVSDSFAESLVRVNEKLDGSRKKYINKVSLLEPLCLHAAALRKTLELLARNGTVVEEIELKESAKSGDLYLIQKHLLLRASGKLNGNQKVQLSGDGSFCVLEAEDEYQAALITASYLSQSNELNKLLLINSHDSVVFEHALGLFNLPLPGSGCLQLKAAAQLLPLAFKLLTRPLDPKHIVEFLKFPDGPIPENLSRNLLRAISQKPGLGNSSWQEVWRDFVKNEGRTLRARDRSLSSDAIEKEAQENVEAFEKWFGASTLAQSSEINSSEISSPAISRTDAEAVCKRVEGWALEQYSESLKKSESLQGIYKIVGQQARLLRELISTHYQDNLQFTQIYKMIDSLAAYGSSLKTAEASPWSVVDHPGQVWDSAGNIIWWGFSCSNRELLRPPFWSEKERQELANNGVFLESLRQKLARESFGWRLPLFKASESLLLVKSKVIAGELAVSHPLVDEIDSILSAESRSKVSSYASSAFSSDKLKLGRLTIRSELADRRVLPGVLREWRINAGLLKPRYSESFSSLEKLFGCRLARVLQYDCGIWPPKGLELPQKQLLLGRLAHEIVHELFSKKKSWTSKSAKKYAEQLLMDLIPKTAASLLLPSSYPQLKEAKEAIPNSVYQLLEFINNASLKVEACEENLKTPFVENSKLGGSIDLLLSKASGEYLVLDFKWTASPERFRNKLAGGTALQLAIYSYLAGRAQKEREKEAGSKVLALKKDQESFPAAGFFMFRQAELFFSSEGVFPQYTFVRRMERELPETFKLTLETYKRLAAELEAGLVTATGVDLDNQSMDAFIYPVLVEPPCLFCKLETFCGRKELQ